eukprot:scaffold159526_cov32-Tisochrysis_lutea.AAC.1
MSPQPALVDPHGRGEPARKTERRGRARSRPSATSPLPLPPTSAVERNTLRATRAPAMIKMGTEGGRDRDRDRRDQNRRGRRVAQALLVDVRRCFSQTMDAISPPLCEGPRPGSVDDRTQRRRDPSIS